MCALTIRNHFTSAASYLLGLVLLGAGIDKLFNVHAFAQALEKNILIPSGWEAHTVYPLIFIEIVVGIGLFFRSCRKEASIIAVLLFTVFAVSVPLNWMIRPDSPCGCWFSISGGVNTPLHIAQSLVLLGLSIWLWFSLSGSRSLVQGR